MISEKREEEIIGYKKQKKPSVLINTVFYPEGHTPDKNINYFGNNQKNQKKPKRSETFDETVNRKSFQN